LEVFDDLLIIERNADESAARAAILGEEFTQTKKGRVRIEVKKSV